MRRLVTTALSLLALGSAAAAADLPPAPQLPPLDAAPAWTGFYAGLNVGGAFGSSRNAFSIAGFEPPSFDTSLEGAIGGAQAGYNWQTGPWVLGLEANFEGSGLS
ncbi:MAG: porin family protein, partial [Roseiarcus sp.]